MGWYTTLLVCAAFGYDLTSSRDSRASAWLRDEFNASASSVLSGRQLANLAGRHPSKVSKIEYGKQTPSEDDVWTWCAHTAAPNRTSDLIAALRNIDAAYPDWRRARQAGIRLEEKKIQAIEAETKLIRGYDPALIPGLLHTPEYAAAIFRQVAEFNRVPSDADDAVAARMNRQQQYLYRGDRRVHYLVGEAALYTTVGDDGVMFGQLDRLMTAMSLPRVFLGIVPLTSSYVVSATNFVIYDNPRCDDGGNLSSIDGHPAERDRRLRPRLRIAGQPVRDRRSSASADRDSPRQAAQCIRRAQQLASALDDDRVPGIGTGDEASQPRRTDRCRVRTIYSIRWSTLRTGRIARSSPDRSAGRPSNRS